MQVTIGSQFEAKKNERIDPQFFHPEYVASFNVVLNGSYSTLSEIAHITDGNHLKIAENFDSADGVRYLRGQDLSTDMILHDRNIVHIPESCFDLLKRSHISPNDILITIVGANTGLVGLVYDPPKKLVANCKLGIARAVKDKILPGYLYSFLIGRYGQHQILRSIRGGGQTGLILPDIRQLRIARLDSEFESTISDLVFDGHSKIAESKDAYSRAQNILLSEFGLVNQQPKHKLTFIKKYSDIQKTERIDAEYYQPKFDEILSALWNRGGVPLSKIASVKKGHQARSAIGAIPYASIKDISGNIIDSIDWAEYSSNLVTVGFNDLALAITGATIGKVGMNKTKQEIAISGDLLKITAKEVSPHYLLTFLGLPIMTDLFKRSITGMTNGHLSPDIVKGVPVPILGKKVMADIEKKVIDFFDYRQQSKHLLGCAKRAVEMAIEQDEHTAINWLEKETQDVGK